MRPSPGPPQRAPPHSPQGTAQGGGNPGVPIPPLLCSHFIPVQHWGMLVGTWCCQSPVPSTPGSPGRHLPGMAHGCHHLQQGSWLRCACWSRAWSLWSPSPWDSSSAAGCQGACGVLPVLRRVRGGGHSWNPPGPGLGLPAAPREVPSTPRPAMGSSGPSPSLLPGDRSPSAHPWVMLGMAQQLALAPHTAPLLGCWPGLLRRSIFGVRGGLAAPVSIIPIPWGWAWRRAKQKCRNPGWSGCTRRCQAGRGPLGGPPGAQRKGPPGPCPWLCFTLKSL